MEKNYTFSGWATRHNVRCSDGRIINKDAFKDCDGIRVPLVWNHQHNDPSNIVGYAILENRPEGVYTYGYCNDTPNGKHAAESVKHGDITSLSIYANHLKQSGSNVVHGAIKEVSLVLAGANPGAYIDNVIQHGEEMEEEAVIYSGEEFELSHADNSESQSDETVGEIFDSFSEKQKKVVYYLISQAMGEKDNVQHSESDEDLSHADEKTVGDIFNAFTEEQKKVVYYLIAKAMEKKEEDANMKHNAFDDQSTENNENTLQHSDIEAVFTDVKRYGSLKESALQHGITNVEYLFPDAKNITPTPTFIDNDTSWVSKVMKAVHRSPFSRVRSLFADITGEEARARGYIKGNYKEEEVFSLLKRTTDPQTIYKKQKLHKDDIDDITDFNVVNWVKAEMRGKLEEEIARAILIGDGRSAASDDKISELHVRPIWKDTEDDLFTIQKTINVSSSATDDQKAKAFIRAAIKARKDYKGSGKPTLYTTEDMVTDCLLLEDNMGRVIYETEEKLKTALRVADIVTVPPMENKSRTQGDSTYYLVGLIANLSDYNVGADHGGAVNMFDDFDIDYNAQKYLMETRCSGALIRPKSAIALEMVFQ